MNDPHALENSVLMIEKLDNNQIKDLINQKKIDNYYT